jgi:hypothetical protein
MEESLSPKGKLSLSASICFDFYANVWYDKGALLTSVACNLQKFYYNIDWIQ